MRAQQPAPHFSSRVYFLAAAENEPLIILMITREFYREGFEVENVHVEVHASLWPEC